MKTIATLSLSGGQGKTTASFMAALLLAKKGFQVLAVDADPQANLTLYCRHSVGENDPTLLEAITGEVKTKEAIYTTEHRNLFLLPADNGLDRAKDFLANSGNATSVLRKRLSEVGEAFDYCVIDSPPQRSQISMAVAGAAEQIFIPAEAVTKGARSLQRTLEMIIDLDELGGLRKPFGEIAIGAIPFRNRYVGRTQTIQSRQAIEAMKKIASNWQIGVLPAIPESERYKQAIDAGCTLSEIGHPDLETGIAVIIEQLERN